MKYPVFASLGYFTVVFPPDLLIKGHKPYAAANNSSSSLLLFCQNSARSCWLQLHFCPHLEQGNYVIPFHLETAVQMLMFWGNIFIFLKKKKTDFFSNDSSEEGVKISRSCSSAGQLTPCCANKVQLQYWGSLYTKYMC